MADGTSWIHPMVPSYEENRAIRMLLIQPANRKKATPLAKYSGQGPAKISVAKDTTILVFKMPKIAVEVRFEIIVSAPKFNGIHLVNALILFQGDEARLPKAVR
jgi:hypothetical protein